MGKIKRKIKDKFEKGLISAVDNRDIPEEGLANATNVVCDIQGKVRQMGYDKTHNTLSDVLNGNLEPGYGLFAFNSDYNVSSNANVETKLLAISDLNQIAIYDSQLNLSEITLGTDKNSVKPNFYYTEGALRVCDSNFTNTNNLPKKYGYISRTWFSGLDPDTEAVISPDWKASDQFCYPPTIHSTTSNTAQNIEWNSTLSASKNPTAAGNISLQVATVDTNGDGQWQKDSGLKFGISFTYASGFGLAVEDQDSPITVIPDALDTSSLDNDNHSLTFTLKIHTGGTDVAAGANSSTFDPRIVGCKIWWCADADGDYAEPLFVMNCFWGRGNTDTAKATTLEGTEQDFTKLSAGIAYINALKVRALPTATYSMENPGQLADSEYESARYKTAVIVNRRAFIGNVWQCKFNRNAIQSVAPASTLRQPAIIDGPINADRMISSPVGKHDIFDEFSILDAARNDGDHIVALASFGDRLVQFKTESIFIVTVSGPDDIIEAEHRYMGIDHPYQYCDTEYGLAWANKNGCYLLNKEGVITNLIDGLLDPNRPRSGQGMDPDMPEGWAVFMGNSGMIGYLPEMKQLVVFEDPAVNGAEGNIYVYDFQTNSWTRGTNRVTSLPKSNIITNYDDTCMYATQQEVVNENITISQIQDGSPGTDPSWLIGNLSGTGSGEITTSTNYCQLWFDVKGNNLIKDSYNSNFEHFGNWHPSNTTNSVPLNGSQFKSPNQSNTSSGVGYIWFSTPSSGSAGDKIGIYLGTEDTQTAALGSYYRDSQILLNTVAYTITFTAKCSSGIATAGASSANCYIQFGNQVADAFALTTSYAEYTVDITPNGMGCLIFYTTYYADVSNIFIKDIKIQSKYLPLCSPFQHNATTQDSLFLDVLNSNITSFIGTNDFNISLGDGTMNIIQPSHNINNINNFYATANGESLAWRSGTGFQTPAYYNANSTSVNVISQTKKSCTIEKARNTNATFSYEYVNLKWGPNDSTDFDADSLWHFFNLQPNQANPRGWLTGASAAAEGSGVSPFDGHPYMRVQRSGAGQDDILVPMYDWNHAEFSNTSVEASVSEQHSLTSKYHNIDTAFPNTLGQLYTTGGTTIVSESTNRNATITIPPVAFKGEASSSSGTSMDDGGIFSVWIPGDWSNHFNSEGIYTFSGSGLGSLDTALSNGLKFNVVNVIIPEWVSDSDPETYSCMTWLGAQKGYQSAAMQAAWGNLRTYYPDYTATITFASSAAAASFDSVGAGIPAVGRTFSINPNRFSSGVGFGDSDSDGIADAFEENVRYSVGINGQDSFNYLDTYITSNNDSGFEVGQALATSLGDIADSAAGQPWLSVGKLIIRSFRMVVNAGGTQVILSNPGADVSGSTADSTGSAYIVAPEETANSDIELISSLHGIDNDMNLPALGLNVGDIIQFQAPDNYNTTYNKCVIKTIAYDAGAKTTTIDIATSASEGADGTQLKHTLGFETGSSLTLIPYGGEAAENAERIDADINRLFTGSGQWVNDPSNSIDTYSIGAGTLNAAVTASPSGVKYATLDEVNWDGVPLVVGNVYCLRYDVTIASRTAGTLSVGFSNDSYSLQSSSYKEYTANATLTGERAYFAYTANHTKIIIHFSDGAAMTTTFDNFSLTEANSSYAYLHTSPIRLKGSGSGTSMLAVNGWVTQKLNVREFVNNEDSGINPIAGTTDLVIETPDYYLGDSPHTNKALYKVSLTFKCSGVFDLWGAFNGAPDYHTLLKPDGNYHSGTVGESNHLKAWRTVDFFFEPSHAPVKIDYKGEQGIKTVRLKINSTKELVGFELNDITIYYRELDR